MPQGWELTMPLSSLLRLLLLLLVYDRVLRYCCCFSFVSSLRRLSPLPFNDLLTYYGCLCRLLL